MYMKLGEKIKFGLSLGHKINHYHKIGEKVKAMNHQNIPQMIQNTVEKKIVSALEKR